MKRYCEIHGESLYKLNGWVPVCSKCQAIKRSGEKALEVLVKKL